MSLCGVMFPGCCAHLETKRPTPETNLSNFSAMVQGKGWIALNPFRDLTVQSHPRMQQGSAAGRDLVTASRRLCRSVQAADPLFLHIRSRLSLGPAPNLHAPVIWMTQGNEGRSTTCVSGKAGTPSCCECFSSPSLAQRSSVLQSKAIVLRRVQMSAVRFSSVTERKASSAVLK